MKYGLPYVGSKNKIAERIVAALPPAEHLYDPFCGGGAVSHCAALSGKYEKVYASDINYVVTKGLKMALAGEFKGESRWISREDFFRLRLTDPYAACCFSFGNDWKTYAYSKELEPYKKAYHQAIYGDPKPYFDMVGIDLSELLKIHTVVARRMAARIIITNAINRPQNIQSQEALERLQKINRPQNIRDISNPDRLQCQEALERLQKMAENPSRIRSLSRLESHERMTRIENIDPMSNIVVDCLSYDEVDILPNSVVYCDIPYQHKKKYEKQDINYNDFFEWCQKVTDKGVPVYVSSYNLPEDRFEEVSAFSHMCSLAANCNKPTTERLYRVKGSNCNEVTRSNT